MGELRKDAVLFESDIHIPGLVVEARVDWARWFPLSVQATRR